MLECMYQNNGIGLAAPQVGILKRLVVIDCSSNKDIKKPLKLINPEITKLSKNTSEFEEGCLSLPSQYAKVIRPSEITLRYNNSGYVFECFEINEVFNILTKLKDRTLILDKHKRKTYLQNLIKFSGRESLENIENEIFKIHYKK